MLVGPLVSAALVIATWFLAHELSAGAGERDPARAETVARLAVGLSIVSAALRHDTADVIPDGAAAMLVALSLAAALRARRTATTKTFGVAGAALGLLLASEPSAGVAVGIAVLVLALGAEDRGRSASWLIVAAIPGAILLLAANRAATGHAFSSPVSAYLAGLEPHGMPAGADKPVAEAA